MPCIVMSIKDLNLLLFQVHAVTGQEMTYSQLQTHIVRTASGLARMGISKGDVVTLFLPNCLEFPVVFLAVTALGAVASAVNGAYTAGMSTTVEYRQDMSMSPWWPLMGLLPGCPIFESRCCNSFKDRVNVDFLCMCPSFKSELTTSKSTRKIAPAMATGWHTSSLTKCVCNLTSLV